MGSSSALPGTTSKPRPPRSGRRRSRPRTTLPPRTFCPHLERSACSRRTRRPSFDRGAPLIRFSRKARVFWPIVSLLLLADCSSKQFVVDQFGSVGYGSRTIIDGVLRFTLAYNQDAAMGIPLSVFSRYGIALFVCG